jgi:hypothetical protein
MPYGFRRVAGRRPAGLFPVFGLALLLAGCALASACRAGPDWGGRGLYVWRVRPDLAALDRVVPEAGWADSRAYVRLFDLDWRNGPSVRAAVEPASRLPADRDWVAVVFCTAASLSNLSARDATWLLSRVGGLAGRVSDRPCREIQLDGDWTASSRESWFAFVAAVDAACRANGVEVTVTLRLHQVRDRAAMGVPPVARASLMLYGTGDPGDFDLPWNGVMDPALAAAYLDPWLASYPLDLDFAFPQYAQLRIFNPWRRLQAMVRLPDAAALPAGERRGRALEAAADGWAGVARIMAGDLLLVDQASPETAAAARRLIARLYRGAPPRLLLFDADPESLRSQNAHEIRSRLLD